MNTAAIETSSLAAAFAQPSAPAAFGAVIKPAVALAGTVPQERKR